MTDDEYYQAINSAATRPGSDADKIIFVLRLIIQLLLEIRKRQAA